MRIKALWGFKGDPVAVGNEDGRVLAGTVLTVDDKYGHHLVGAKLAEPFGDEDQAAYRARVALGNIDPAALSAAHADLTKREGQLGDALTDFDARKLELEGLQADISAREAALAAREAELSRRETELEQKVAEAQSNDGKEGGKPDESGTPGTKGPKETKPSTPKETK